MYRIIHLNIVQYGTEQVSLPLLLSLRLKELGKLESNTKSMVLLFVDITLVLLVFEEWFYIMGFKNIFRK